MAYEIKPNTGSLFKADAKTKDTDRDYNGSGLINEVPVWISGWINTPQGGGAKYLSLKFTPKEAKPAEQAVPAGAVDAAEDVPF